jgi:rhodanese-related sulfurtransferase
MSFSGATDYAGDISATEAYERLQSSPVAVLVDVRTVAEWTFVGLPDIEATGRPRILLEWQTFPPSENPSPFTTRLDATLRDLGAGPDAELFFLCRSGGRSRAAAIAMTGTGYQRCYNVADGFEGPLDPEGHRGRVGGWKVDGLPWKQS